MTTQPHRDDLIQLRAELAAQRAVTDALRAKLDRPQRCAPRRFLPLALVGLLVALLPLSLFAAGPFTDLNGGADHAAANADIQVIADAGITKGCNPPAFTAYCPNDLVTREQMASFLARTAGLGGNAPVANAKTVGGYAASDLTRVAFSHTALASSVPASGTYVDIAEVTLTVPGGASQAVAVRGTVSLTNEPSGGYVILFAAARCRPFLRLDLLPLSNQ